MLNKINLFIYSYLSKITKNGTTKSLKIHIYATKYLYLLNWS